MEKLAVFLTESAMADLGEIRNWYAEQDVPEVGERLLNEIFSAIQDLTAFPDRGRIVPEFGLPQLRELILPPFRIVYRRDRNRVRIVRVWRSERLLRLP